MIIFTSRNSPGTVDSVDGSGESILCYASKSTLLLEYTQYLYPILLWRIHPLRVVPAVYSACPVLRLFPILSAYFTKLEGGRSRLRVGILPSKNHLGSFRTSSKMRALEITNCTLNTMQSLGINVSTTSVDRGLKFEWSQLFVLSTGHVVE